jgi:hypothetical protein
MKNREKINNRSKAFMKNRLEFQRSIRERQKSMPPEELMREMGYYDP